LAEGIHESLIRELDVPNRILRNRVDLFTEPPRFLLPTIVNQEACPLVLATFDGASLEAKNEMWSLRTFDLDEATTNLDCLELRERLWILLDALAECVRRHLRQCEADCVELRKEWKAHQPLSIVMNREPEPPEIWQAG